MKRITSIVLFASVFAVAVGALGLSGNASTLMVSATSQTPENVGMLGHVEYKILDEFGEIKAYMQNDNVVVESGKDCASQMIFTNAHGQVGNCIANDANGAAPGFTYIGIGNGSSGNINVLNKTLADKNDNGGVGDDTDGLCSRSATGVGQINGGDMARKNVTASFDVTGTNTIVTLNTSNDPFTFITANATNVIDSGIFNADYATPEDGRTCPAGQTQTAGTDWNMFSRQLLNGATGIAVGNGDSLSVKWTITVGT